MIGIFRIPYTFVLHGDILFDSDIDTGSGSLLFGSGNSIVLFSVGEKSVEGNDGGGART